MSDVNKQVYEQTKNVTLQVAKITSATISEISKVLLMILIEQAEKNKANKLLNQDGEVALKELYDIVSKGKGALMNIKIPDEDIEKMKECMKKNEVLFAVTDLKSDNAKMVLYLDRDSEHMKDAITMYQAQKGLINEISPDLFIKNYKNTNIGVIENVSAIDLELFRHYSKENNFLYAALPSDDGYKILYDNEFKAKIAETLENVSIDLTGAMGPLVKEQVEIRIKGRKAVNIAVEDAEKEYFIVNGKSPKNYVHLTADGFSYYKNNQAIVTMNRSNPEFMKSAYAAIEGLKEPIVLTKDEFNLPDKERWELLNAVNSIYPTDYSIDIDKIKGASVGTPELNHLAEAKEYKNKFTDKEIIVRNQKSLSYQLARAKEKSIEENRDAPVKSHTKGER